MKIVVKILPKDTGIKKYTDPSDCPLARALVRAGFTNPSVGPFNFDCEKKRISYYGEIPDKYFNVLMDTHSKKLRKSVTMNLTLKKVKFTK